MKSKRLALYTSCILLSFPLTGCGEITTFKAVTAGIAATTNDIFKRPNVNLKEKNYAAADFLVQQMRITVPKNQFIVAQPLEESDNAGITSPLGHKISEGVGLRLTELGYDVALYDTVQSGLNNPYPLPSAGKSPDLVLKGTYLRKGMKQVDVTLLVINLKSGKIAARFDYPLLMSNEVRNLAQTQPRIYRVPQ